MAPSEITTETSSAAITSEPAPSAGKTAIVPTTDERSTNLPIPLSQIDAILDTSETKQPLDSEWLMDQNPNHFIIQLASSSDRDQILLFAEEIETTEPIVIYAYKKEQSVQLTYGLATSLYDDLDTGLAEVKLLPQASHGSARGCGQLKIYNRAYIKLRTTNKNYIVIKPLLCSSVRKLSHPIARKITHFYFFIVAERIARNLWSGIYTAELVGLGWLDEKTWLATFFNMAIHHHYLQEVGS